MILRISEYLEADDSSGTMMVQCSKCKYVFCPITDNYKNYALVNESPLTKTRAQNSATKRFVFREFYCPSCGTLLQVDMTLKNSAILHDIRLKV
jgi:acetone carboxylase gamma subunit